MGKINLRLNWPCTAIELLSENLFHGSYWKDKYLTKRTCLGVLRAADIMVWPITKGKCLVATDALLKTFSLVLVRVHLP